MSKSLPATLPVTFSDSEIVFRSQHQRVPGPLQPGYPFRVSYKLQKRRGTIVLQLTTPRRWVKAITAALGLLTFLAGDLDRMAGRGERDCLIVAERRAWLKRQAAINRAYASHRSRGLLHREAVRALVADPRFQDLQYDFALFNRVAPTDSQWRQREKEQRQTKTKQAAGNYRSSGLLDRATVQTLIAGH
jgi:hypothetical protein